jgi:hypothetical protein
MRELFKRWIAATIAQFLCLRMLLSLLLRI